MENKINKFLQGIATEQEMLEIEEWVLQSEENKKYFSKLYNIYAISSTIEQTNVSDIANLNRLLRLIQKKEKNNKILKWSYISTIAACFIIIVSLFAHKRISNYKNDVNYILSQNSVQLEYSTQYGTKSKIVLPDSSVVILNSGSSISFPSKFLGDTRTVEFEGEGFFTIIKDSLKPMVIVTPQGYNVKVLGTEFNLSAYRDDEDIDIMLLSGRIELETASGDIISNITPNQRCVINNHSTQPTIDTPKETLPYLGWKDGWLIFDDLPLDVVFKKLKRVYGTEFIIEDDFVKNKKLSAKFKEESLTQVLDLMSRIELLTYKIEDNKVYITNF